MWAPPCTMRSWVLLLLLLLRCEEDEAAAVEGGASGAEAERLCSTSAVASRLSRCRRRKDSSESVGTALAGRQGGTERGEARQP